MTMTQAQPTTHTLEVPGAVLAYDFRQGASSDRPALFLIGSPMGAAGFGTLARHFADRTVVTYDPRGVERSRRTDSVAESTPDEHAADLHRIISVLDLGSVDMFASSGGAVNALVLVGRHPGDVGTLVAHEPPAARLLPDAKVALAVSRDIHQTYERDGMGPAMARFITLVSHEGELTPDWLGAPAPDPAMFGLPTEDDGSRDDPLLGQNIVTSTHVELDIEALKAASTRIVIAVGAESEGQLAHRAGVALAGRLGGGPVIFPSHHGGFLGGEYGQTGDPEGFAGALREVLG
jgi:pimeloyl-ACP methyl ester carboxylesterase